MNEVSLAEWPYFLPLAIALAAVLGASMGSFVTLITYRLPRDEPIGMTRSRCPQCTTLLSVPDLVPIFSWLAMRAKCRHCKAPIHMRYPITELACALGAALLVWYYGVQWETLALCGLWWCIVAIIVTDLEHYIILDEVQSAVGVLGVIFAWALEWDAIDVIGSAATGLFIGLALKYGFIYFRNKDGLGLGDVKFLGVAGIWLGSAINFVPFLFYSGVLGIISGIAWQLLKRGEKFPFGPALALALFVGVVFPPSMNGFWQLYGLLGK